MTVIDLYHIYSSPMFYNEQSGQVFQGNHAMNMHRQRKKQVGFRRFENAKKVDIDGRTITAYGLIYEL